MFINDHGKHIFASSGQQPGDLNRQTPPQQTGAVLWAFVALDTRSCENGLSSPKVPPPSLSLRCKTCFPT